MVNIKTKRKLAGITCGVLAALMLGSSVLGSISALADEIDMSAYGYTWDTSGGEKALLKDGQKQSGWVNIGGNWYYIDPVKFTPVTGLTDISGVYYYFDGNGVMQTGKQLIGEDCYIFSGSGALQTGWIAYNGFWYYSDATGKLQSGITQVGGKTYFLSQNNGDDFGKLVSGWVKTKSNATTDSDKNKDVYYYFDPVSGAAYVGTHTIGETTYNFNANGMLSKDKDDNYQSISGTVTNEILYSVSYSDNDSNNNENKVNSSTRGKINKYIKKMPTAILVNFFTKNKIEYDGTSAYVHDESYTTYDDFYDDEDSDDNSRESTTETVRYVYWLDGSKLEFCKEPVNVLRGFGRYIDEYAANNIETYKAIGKPSETNEFEAIMDAEVGGLSYDNELEFENFGNDFTRHDYFDVCYTLYVLGDKDFIESCPQSYAYVQKIEKMVIDNMRVSNSNDSGYYTANFVRSDMTGNVANTANISEA